MTHDIIFSRIGATHVDGIWQLIEALKAEAAEISFTELESSLDVEAWLGNPAHLVYVATNETNDVLAVVRGKRQVTPEQAHAVFLTAATAANARGLGLAARLTDFALNAMRNEGVTVARIYVYSDNKASLNAVSKLGFEHSGTIYRHHKCVKTDQYVDDVIFHKFLD